MKHNSDQGFIQIQNTELFFLENECAGLGSRAAAFFLDSVFKGLMILVLVFVFSKIDGFDGPMRYFSFTVLGLLYGSYHFVFESVMAGKTPGKHLMGVRVIKNDGSRLTVIDSLLRNVMRLLDSMPGSYLIGAMVMFFEKYNRRVGDLVSGTLVIHDRPHSKSISRFIDTIMLESKPSREVKIAGLEKLDNKERDIVKTIYLRIESMSPEERLRISEKLLSKIVTKVKISGTRDAEEALYEIYKRL